MTDVMIQRALRVCPACGSNSQRPLERYSHAEWNIVSCTLCEFVYLSEAPVYAALSEDLAWTNQFEKEKRRRRQSQPIVSWLDRKLRWRLHILRDNEWAYISTKITSGRVLDVGCGAVNRVPDQFTPFGIEIGKEAAAASDKLMRHKGGHVIHAPTIEGLTQFADGFFDGVIMRSYLEHESHPREVLRALHDKLRPGGVVYVKVPNFGTLNRMIRGVDWCGFRFPDHLNYFDVRGLERMAKSTGYRFQLKNGLSRLTNDNMHAFLTRP